MGTIDHAKVNSHLGGNLSGSQIESVKESALAASALVNAWCGKKWSESQELGAIMLAARLFRRRNSPGGVETLGDITPVYVSRRDPDIAMLIGISTWQKPRVG